MKIKEEDYIGHVYQSSKYGPYVINKVVGKSNNKSRATLVEIQFMKSNAITTVELSNALRGEVRDPQYGLNYNSVYLSDNYGPYIVLEIYKGCAGTSTKAKIRFLNSGHEKVVFMKNALNGEIGDVDARVVPLDTNLLDPEEREKRLLRFARNIWHYMIKRCYNSSAQNYDWYGGSGVKVCERWLDQEAFIYDIQFLPQYDKWRRFPTIYQLDKDYIQFKQGVPKDQRIYAPETCMFLHKVDNTNLKSIEYKMEHDTDTEYFGVVIAGEGKYGVQITIGGIPHWLGTFSDIIAAANAYNYYYKMYAHYELVPLINDVPYMPPNEFIKYNLNPKLMAEKVDK